MHKMSWLQKLFETYEACQSEIGNLNDTIPLLPICHTTQKAHIQITIDSEGNFLRASIVPKDDSRTIIPCTEESSGRTGKKPTAHPLCDKLQYIAGDFNKYGGTVTVGYKDKPEEPYNIYSDLLDKWCFSSYRHSKVKSVRKYIQKQELIKDLIKECVLHIGSDGKLLKQWEDKEKKSPEIFSLLPGRYNTKKDEIENWQADAFVRWEVEFPGDPQIKVWTDKSIWKSWIDYYLSNKINKGLCYVSGTSEILAEQHPAKIRNDGDKAKLISSNDLTNFTFRGRFSTPSQVCDVSYDITQKAHSALRWLISRQGYRNGDQAVVAWAVSGNEIPDPMADTLGLFKDEEARSEIKSPTCTAQAFGRNLSKMIAGYKAKLNSTEGIVVMGLDSATPGRMSVTFYRELTGSEILQRVSEWHESSAWWQDFGKDKETKSPIRFIGAPSPKDIAFAAYGAKKIKLDDKLKKSTVERLLPCIVDGAQIPFDMVQSAVKRSCNRIGLVPWEWEKTLGITCSLYKKYYQERRYEVALEEDRKTRDYLYGRLLAVADSIEGWALRSAGEKRETNAARMMQRFAVHPCSTWKNIELSLAPYKARLGSKAVKLYNLMDRIIASFESDEFINDKPLSGEFLLGYHCQRFDLKPKVKSNDDVIPEDENALEDEE
jgi:CRISPR-associated protein Csd1